MLLSQLLQYAGNPREAADQVVALEKAGLDTVWVPEAAPVKVCDMSLTGVQAPPSSRTW